MQKYGFTFKTATIDEIKFVFSPQIFSFSKFRLDFLQFYQVLLCVLYICSLCMGWLVWVCSMGTAGKEVVFAGITWFSKCQGFDVVPSVVQQRSCRQA